MKLPQPNFYSDWRGWAKALVDVFGAQGQLPPVTLPHFSLARLPRAAQDGQIIFVPDATGGGVAVYSLSGDWLRFDDNTIIS